MAFPTLSRSYAFNSFPTLTAGPVDTVAPEYLFEIFTSATTLGSNPMTVNYSCDGNTAGTPGDGVNLWFEENNLVWNTGAHSWVVLENVDGLQWLIDLDFSATSKHSANMLISNSAGFTGGTTTVRPTATDEVSIIRHGNTTTWMSNSVFTPTRIWCHMSDDGKIFRWNVINNSVCHSYGFIEEINGAPTGATNAYLASIGTVGGFATPVYRQAAHGADIDIAVITASNRPTALGHFTCQGAGSLSFNQVTHNEEWSGESQLFGVGLFVPTTPMARGFKGSRYDAYWINTPPNNIGIGFDAGTGAGNEFLSYQHMAYPHNNTVVTY